MMLGESGIDRYWREERERETRERLAIYADWLRYIDGAIESYRWQMIPRMEP